MTANRVLRRSLCAIPPQQRASHPSTGRASIYDMLTEALELTEHSHRYIREAKLSRLRAQQGREDKEADDKREGYPQ